jgi:hypothetical protein
MAPRCWRAGCRGPLANVQRCHCVNKRSRRRLLGLRIYCRAGSIAIPRHGPMVRPRICLLCLVRTSRTTTTITTITAPHLDLLVQVKRPRICLQDTVVHFCHSGWFSLRLIAGPCRRRLARHFKNKATLRQRERAMDGGGVELSHEQWRRVALAMAVMSHGSGRRKRRRKRGIARVPLFGDVQLLVGGMSVRLDTRSTTCTTATLRTDAGLEANVSALVLCVCGPSSPLHPDQDAEDGRVSKRWHHGRVRQSPESWEKRSRSQK